MMWARSVRGERDPQSGKTIVKDIPILVIDDEADNASINTNPLPRDETGNILDDYDVTAINGLIRQLLEVSNRVHMLDIRQLHLPIFSSTHKEKQIRMGRICFHAVL